MTRKQLPKAITRSSEDLREIAAGAVTDEEVAAPSRPVARVPLPAASIRAAPQVARRRTQARKIVERHKMYAAMGGLFPMPIVNVAGVTAIIMRMVKALSDLYEVPFEQDRIRSIVIGVMGGAVPTGLAAATASTLVFVVPGSGLVGLAVSSLTAAALTRGIGFDFVERFETGAMSLGASATEQS